MSKIADKPQLLLKHHLKQLKLPTVLAEYEKQAHECAQAGVDHVRYLLRLAELELIERERRMVDRRTGRRSSRQSRASTASTSPRSRR